MSNIVATEQFVKDTSIPIPDTASVGQIIQVSDIDENGKPTGWEAADIPKQIQSDWNQNDTAATDYVKNRTHYKYVDTIVYFDGIDADKESFIFDDVSWVKLTNTSITKDQLIGKTISYTIFSEPQVKESYIIDEDIMADIPTNTAFVIEPFLFASENITTDSNNVLPVGIYAYSCESLGNKYTASITNEAIKKIDPEYLPEQLQADWSENDSSASNYIKSRPFYDEDWVLDTSNVLENNCINSDVGFILVSSSPDDFNNVDSNNLYYTYGTITNESLTKSNGVGYQIYTSYYSTQNTTVAYVVTQENIEFSVSHNGYNYTISNPSIGIWVKVDPQSDKKASIYGKEIHKIDSKYLPDIETSQSYMTVIVTQNEDGTNSANKTYDEIISAIQQNVWVEAVFYGTILPLFYYDVDNGEICFQVNDNYGQVACMSFTIYSNDSIEGDFYRFYELEGATSTDDGNHGIVPAPLAGEQDKFLKGDGTWADIPTYTADDVGAIPCPDAAEVGQTIMVTEVDENSVPTAWETKDIPKTVYVNFTISNDAIESIDKTFSEINQLISDGNDVILKGQDGELYACLGFSEGMIAFGYTVPDIFNAGIYSYYVLITQDVNYYFKDNSSNIREANDETIGGVKAVATTNDSYSEKVRIKSDGFLYTKTIPTTASEIGLGSVENKSSETIRNEITKDNVTTALGYTPYTPNEVDNKLSALETNIDWKEAVDTYDDIATTYSSPEDGWTVNVKDVDYTYRYNGTEWVVISANAIPKATDSVDGLLSKEDHANYEDANSKKHTHDNKIVLDGISDTLLTEWNVAYSHSQESHAPNNAQANVIEEIKVNGTTVAPIDKSVDITVPTKVSDLTNDSGFITSIPDDYVTEAELTAKGYLTSYTETDPTVPDWAKAATKPTYTASEVGALPADTVIPSIDGLASETYVDNAIAGVNQVPSCTVDDNDKILSVVNGIATWVSVINAEGVKY